MNWARRPVGLAYGRRRAAARVRGGRFAVHPGWRGRVPSDYEVVTDQPLAMEQLRKLIDAQDWCLRVRREWTTMLTAMVWAMDWRTGLVTGISREQLAATVDRSTRSVSRLWAWAENAGLIARVEEGASAEWLGTDRNRSATFVFLAPRGTAVRHAERRLADLPSDPEVPVLPLANTGVEESGNPPVPHVEIYPLARRPLNSTNPARSRWLGWRIPETPSQRHAAASEVVRRAGLDDRRLDFRRLHGLLLRWWDQGASPVGLLYMLDHHPDRPGESRGPAFRGVRDPLGVLGFRLAPWTGRLGELPAHLHGRRGDYLAAQRDRMQRILTSARSSAGAATSGDLTTSGGTAAATGNLSDRCATDGTRRPDGSDDGMGREHRRAAGQAAIAAHLAALAARKRLGANSPRELALRRARAERAYLD